MGPPSTVVEKTIERLIGSGRFNGVTLSAYRESDASQFHFCGGALDSRTPYFATGTSKLYVTAILMQLREEGKIALDTPFVSYLEGLKVCTELHVKDTVDYTDQITIRHLMSQTSGLGDFFIYKNRGRNMQHALVNGVDSAWSFEDMITRTRSHGALAIPGDVKKATFADVNFQILGKIIEQIEGLSFAEVLHKRITKPLGLMATYLYSDPSDKRPLNLMSKYGEVNIPLTIASFGADNGIVTTSREALTFVRAFFEGYLFDREKLKDLHDWRPLMYPSEYGVGMARLKMPRTSTLPMRWREPLAVARPIPTLYGHIGMGCASLFYAPEFGIYIAGTTNRLTAPMTCFRLALRAIEAVHRGEVDGQLSRAEAGVGRFASVQAPLSKADRKAPDWAAKPPSKSLGQISH